MQEQLAALCLTIAIELLVAMPWRLTQLKGRTQWLRWAGLIAAASLLTHPVAWWMNTQLAAHLPFWERASVIEALVVLGEAALYWKVGELGVWRALGVAASANMASFGFGLVLMHMGWWF